jgi:hypothetical protein
MFSLPKSSAEILLAAANRSKIPPRKPKNDYNKDRMSTFSAQPILDVILANSTGKRKLRTWIRQSAAVDLVCDVITEEMNVVQKAERLPGVAAITPEFIKTWSVSTHRELIPCLSRILFAAAQTSIAEEKNKKKHPDMVCLSRRSLFDLEVRSCPDCKASTKSDSNQFVVRK